MITTGDTLILKTCSLLERSYRTLARPGLCNLNISDRNHGKMLRTRLASALLGQNERSWPDGVDAACAAIELIHSASLFHDDVVDGATLRRGQPTLWSKSSQNSAILFGDILLCEALRLLTDSAARALLVPFLDKVREVCLAEAEQELELRGEQCDEATCVRIARGKTGPLFAFVAQACAGKDQALADALEEAGYRIGTAYQLADDLLDEIGSEPKTGKTLGTDRLRRKYTLAQGEGMAERVTLHIQDLCDSAVRLLMRWPKPHAGLLQYLEQIFYPCCGLAELQETGQSPVNGGAL
jgi:heptaprenyl diphosphate synthase